MSALCGARISVRVFMGTTLGGGGDAHIFEVSNVAYNGLPKCCVFTVLHIFLTAYFRHDFVQLWVMYVANTREEVVLYLEIEAP